MKDERLLELQKVNTHPENFLKGQMTGSYAKPARSEPNISGEAYSWSNASLATELLYPSEGLAQEVPGKVL